MSSELHVDTLIKHMVKQLNIHAFRACFETDSSTDGKVPSRAAFCRAFEHTLKRLACTCGGEAIPQRSHDRDCPYNRLMGRDRAPNFVLHYPGPSGWRNGRLTVDFAFAGESVQLLPFVVFALDGMELVPNGSETSKLSLLEVLAIPDGNRIYDGKDRRLEMKLVGPLPVLHPEFDGKVSSITIKFVSPINLAYSGTSSVIPEFSTLFGCLWRRMVELLPEDLTVRNIRDVLGTREAMERVRLVKMKLKWRKTPPSGHDGSGKNGGIVGYAVYTGSLEPFMPLLRMGEWIGIDDGSWMNTGRICVEVHGN
jgi:hypothetical protein